MLAIGRIGDDVYGVSITDEIEATTGKEYCLALSMTSSHTFSRRDSSLPFPETQLPSGVAEPCYFRLTSSGRFFVQEIQQCF